MHKTVTTENQPWVVGDRVQRTEGKTVTGTVESMNEITAKDGVFVYVKVRWDDTKRTTLVLANRLKAAQEGEQEHSDERTITHVALF